MLAVSSARVAPETSNSGQNFGRDVAEHAYGRSVSVFGRIDEGLYHFGLSEIAVEAVQLIEQNCSRRTSIRPPAHRSGSFSGNRSTASRQTRD